MKALIPEAIDLEQFQYNLPNDRIAKYPVKQRDQSNLLYYKSGRIQHHRFDEISKLLPENSLLIGNNTKVIPARIVLQRNTGAKIELFLLEPEKFKGSLEEFMNQTQSACWKCLVGNQKKWKNDEVLCARINVDRKTVKVEAQLTKRGSPAEIQINWSGSLKLNQLLEYWGQIPLPPYLNRKAEKTDRETYQTVYAKNPGAVAAPTAGLHFTPYVFEKLKSKNIEFNTLNLHVGAGTFQPVKEFNVLNHPMHYERFEVSLGLIKNIIANPKRYAVGTTSLRTLESLYWMGVKLNRQQADFNIIHKHEVFTMLKHSNEPLTFEQSFKILADHLESKNRNSLTGETGIMIVPGYPIQSIQGLITNFHQPGSTLLMLIAALIGDNWRKLYHEALKKEYRFLSYGDSSLLVP